MPFEHGTFAATIFKLASKLPENYLELFAADTAGMLDQVKDEPQIGWVSGRHLLESKIDEETAICGGHLYLNLRKAERKIPSVLMKAICKREELVYMQANNALMAPSRVKREIKKDVIEKHLMKMPPSLAGVPVVIDLSSNMLYLGTGSTSQIDNFIAFFYKTTNIEPRQLGIGEMLEDMFHTTEVDLPVIKFSGHTDGELTPGRDFLTWLWYYSEKEGGRVSLEQFGNFDIMIEGPLTFAYSAEAQGAAETTLKKGGSPQRSAEAKAALIVGKKLKKAKFVMARGEDVWSGGVDADHFTFSGLSLPEGEEMDMHTRFAERIMNLDIFQRAMKAYFKKFVETVKALKWPETEKKLQKWALERDSY
jgi:hypothetical protein